LIVVKRTLFRGLGVERRTLFFGARKLRTGGMPAFGGSRIRSRSGVSGLVRTGRKSGQGTRKSEGKSEGKSGYSKNRRNAGEGPVEKKPGENARRHGRPATARPVITQIFRLNPQLRPQKPTAPTILPAQITEAHAKSRLLVRKSRVVYPLSVVREND